MCTVRLVMALVLGGASVFPELTLAAEKNIPVATKKALTPVSQILKDLQFGSNIKKSSALLEVANRLSDADGAIPDAEIIAEQDKVTRLIISILKNPFGGKLSDEAVLPLAGFAKRDPAIVDMLLGEIAQDRSSNRMLSIRAIRTLGLVGVPVKEKTSPILTKMLRELPRNTFTAPLINEAAVALALLGGPYDPDVMPDVIKGMMQVKDADTQVKIALQVLTALGEQKGYAKELEFVLITNFEKFLSGIETPSEIFEALVKLGTPNALRALADAVLSTSKPVRQVDRSAAAKALGMCRSPSPLVIDALSKALLVKHFESMLDDVCNALQKFGSTAAPAKPSLESLLAGLQTGKMNASNEKRRIQMIRKVDETLKLIELASKSPVVSTTNQVPQQMPQEVKRSESREGDEDMSSDGPLDAAGG